VITTTLHRRQGFAFAINGHFLAVHVAFSEGNVWRCGVPVLWQMCSLLRACVLLAQRYLTAISRAATHAAVAYSIIVVSEPSGFLSIVDISAATHNVPSAD